MKHHRINVNFISCIIIVLIICGCGGNKITKQDHEIQNHFKPVVLKKSGSAKRPAWTYETSFFKDNDGFHFIGGVKQKALQLLEQLHREV